MSVNKFEVGDMIIFHPPEWEQIGDMNISERGKIISCKSNTSIGAPEYFMYQIISSTGLKVWAEEEELKLDFEYYRDNKIDIILDN